MVGPGRFAQQRTVGGSEERVQNGGENVLFVVLLFFKEPRRSEEGETASLNQVGKNFLTVLSNPRFMIFLLIFTGYWIVFWQEFIARDFHAKSLLQAEEDV